MKLLFAIGVLLITNGCTKEEITLYYAYLNNTTLHKIEIKPYFDGNINPNKTITIMANESREIANGFDRGIVNNAGFNSSYLSGSDSIVVVFDNVYSITHYFNPPPGLASNYYLYSSNRNIYNKDNYVYSFQDLSKQKRESKYNYSFNEQDYLDAN